MVTLDDVRGINQLPDFGRILEERGQFIPVVPPRTHNQGILSAPSLFKLLQFVQRRFFRRGFVDGLQRGGNLFNVFVRHVFDRVADLVNDAFLNLGLGVAGRNGLAEPVEVVDTRDENVLYAAVSQFIQHMQPEFRRFVLADPDAEHVLVTFQIDADGHVGGFVDDGAILFHLEVDCVQEHDGIHRLKRTILPLFDQRAILFVTLEMNAGETSIP